MRNDAATQLISAAPGGHLPPLYHTQVLFSQIYILQNSQWSDITNPKNILSGHLVWKHKHRAWRNENVFIFGHSYRNRQPPWCAPLLVISIKPHIKAHSEVQSHCVKHLQPCEYGPHGVILVTALLVTNSWLCDDSLCWETSCSVGVAVRLSL